MYSNIAGPKGSYQSLCSTLDRGHVFNTQKVDILVVWKLQLNLNLQ